MSPRVTWPSPATATLSPRRTIKIVVARNFFWSTILVSFQPPSPNYTGRKGKKGKRRKGKDKKINDSAMFFVGIGFSPVQLAVMGRAGPGRNGGHRPPYGPQSAPKQQLGLKLRSQAGAWELGTVATLVTWCAVRPRRLFQWWHRLSSRLRRRLKPAATRRWWAVPPLHLMHRRDACATPNCSFPATR